MPTREPQPAPFAISHDASRSLWLASSERDRTVPRNSAAGCEGIARSDALRSSGMLSDKGPPASSEFRCFGRDWGPLMKERFSVADKGSLPENFQKIGPPLQKSRFHWIKSDRSCVLNKCS